MSAVLLHYANGSCTADWLRMSRTLEATEDFAVLGVGPLLPESPMRSAGDRAPVGAAADEVRQLNALIPLSGPDDGRSDSGEGRHFIADGSDLGDFRLMCNIMRMRSRMHRWEYVRELAFQGALELYWEGGV